MFEEENYKPIPLTPKVIEAFRKIKEYKVYGYCCQCGSKIPLIWSDFLKLEGQFHSKEYSISEIFECTVPCINTMICNSCFYGDEDEF